MPCVLSHTVADGSSRPTTGGRDAQALRSVPIIASGLDGIIRGFCTESSRIAPFTAVVRLHRSPERSANRNEGAQPEGGAHMAGQSARLHRWDEQALEKVTEMISRKMVTGEREMIAQIYLKTGALVPIHSHESEQMTYVLQGALRFLVGGEEVTVRGGRGAPYPVLGRAPGRSSRGYLRARRVQPDPAGLAGQDRRLLLPVRGSVGDEDAAEPHRAGRARVCRQPGAGEGVGVRPRRAGDPRRDLRAGESGTRARGRRRSRRRPGPRSSRSSRT